MAATWIRVPGWPVSSQGTMGLTEAGPPASEDGIALHAVGSLRVVLAAPAGQTLTGAGFLRCWFKDRFGIWSRHSDLDEELVEYVGQANAPAQPIAVNHNEGRMAFLADSVGVSGGTALVVYLWAIDRLTRGPI